MRFYKNMVRCCRGVKLNNRNYNEHTYKATKIDNRGFSTSYDIYFWDFGIFVKVKYYDCLLYIINKLDKSNIKIGETIFFEEKDIKNNIQGFFLKKRK